MAAKGTMKFKSKGSSRRESQTLQNNRKCSRLRKGLKVYTFSLSKVMIFFPSDSNIIKKLILVIKLRKKWSVKHVWCTFIIC